MTHPVHGIIFVQQIYIVALVYAMRVSASRHKIGTPNAEWSVDLGCVSTFTVTTENLQCTLRIL